MSDSPDGLGRHPSAVGATPVFVAYDATVDAIVHADEHLASGLPAPGDAVSIAAFPSRRHFDRNPDDAGPNGRSSQPY